MYPCQFRFGNNGESAQPSIVVALAILVMKNFVLSSQLYLRVLLYEEGAEWEFFSIKEATNIINCT